jgi:LysM repeat protein
MRKIFSVFIIFLFFYSTTSAQGQLLIVEGKSPNLYITHTVTAKENYYSVGRLYNVSPKELASYNGLTFEKGFTLGQIIKIPLAPNNFSQGVAPTENEVLLPVYHVMRSKEGLYRVSLNYNKVPLDALKKWNKLSGDAVSTGTKIIVGYLKVLKDQSPLATEGLKNSPPDLTMNSIGDKKQVANPVNSNEKKDVATVQESKEAKAITQEKAVDNPNNVTPSGSINFNGGKFKTLFTDQTKNRSLQNENGVAATFKTTSGWQDGKYYCFHNTAVPGTIMMITNTANGKSVYAKVLDAIPDIKQNSGLLIRISNSAADELGAIDNKFDCSISYVK